MQQAEETEKGRLFMDPDVDKAREFFRHKTRQMRDKVSQCKKQCRNLSTTAIILP